MSSAVSATATVIALYATVRPAVVMVLRSASLPTPTRAISSRYRETMNKL